MAKIHNQPQKLGFVDLAVVVVHFFFLGGGGGKDYPHKAFILHYFILQPIIHYLFFFF